MINHNILTNRKTLNNHLYKKDDYEEEETQYEYFWIKYFERKFEKVDSPAEDTEHQVEHEEGANHNQRDEVDPVEQATQGIVSLEANIDEFILFFQIIPWGNSSYYSKLS